MKLVLLADDEPAVVEVLGEVVEDLGHRVVAALDGEDALRLARSERPALVVTDHVMPKLTGLDLCRRLKADPALKHIPVILLSAALPPGDYEVEAFLSKPFELGQFEEMIRKVLGEGDAVRRHPPRSKSELRLAEVRAARLYDELGHTLERARASLASLERGLLPLVPSTERQQLCDLDATLEKLASTIATLRRMSPAHDHLADGGVLSERLEGLAHGADR